MSQGARRIFGLVLLGLVAAVPAYGQEPFAMEGIPPESDYVYGKHYEQVQEIMKTPDLAERERKLEAFYQKLHPKAKMKKAIVGFFGQIVEEYKKKGMTAQAKALTDKLAKWFPEATGLVAQQFQEAYDSKNWSRAIELGEKLRAEAPNDARVLVMLAEAYQGAGNTAKVLELAPKIVELLGPQKGINYAVLLGDHYRKQGDAARAQHYYDQALQAYPNTPPPGWTADQWKAVKITALQIRATAAWKAEDFRKVVQTYDQMLKLDPKNDAAWLFKGLSHWRLQELDAAQDALAKAVVLGGPNSQKARQYLEQLYKPRNNNSLEGLDQVLAKAKSELGV